VDDVTFKVSEAFSTPQGKTQKIVTVPSPSKTHVAERNYRRAWVESGSPKKKPEKHKVKVNHEINYTVERNYSKFVV